MGYLHRYGLIRCRSNGWPTGYAPHVQSNGKSKAEPHNEVAHFVQDYTQRCQHSAATR